MGLSPIAERSGSAGFGFFESVVSRSIQFPISHGANEKTPRNCHLSPWERLNR